MRTMRELHAERYSVEQILRIVSSAPRSLGFGCAAAGAMRYARTLDAGSPDAMYAQGESPRLSL